MGGISFQHHKEIKVFEEVEGKTKRDPNTLINGTLRKFRILLAYLVTGRCEANPGEVL